MVNNPQTKSIKCPEILAEIKYGTSEIRTGILENQFYLHIRLLNSSGR